MTASTQPDTATPTTTTLKKICAWCDRVIHEGVGPVSHGICPACKTVVLQKTKSWLRKHGRG